MLSRLILSCAVLLASTPTSARQWPETGGWTIMQGDTLCAMTKEFEGPGDSEMSISIDDKGGIFMTDVNADWSSVEGAIYEDITADMDGTAYGGRNAMGVVIDGKKGFAIKLAPEMLPAMAAARSIRLYKGETKMDHLNLGGTGAAIAMTRRCIADVRAQQAAAERERQRFSNIEKDPFGKP